MYTPIYKKPLDPEVVYLVETKADIPISFTKKLHIM
jgi:hypothetical protein